MNDNKSTVYHSRALLLLFFAFLAGFTCGEFFLRWQKSRSAGELDRRYVAEHGRAAETIGRLAAELERERAINRELRKYNNRAKEITYGLTGTSERNVRNLQDAIGLIGEIRKELKVLADFYDDSGPGGGDAQRYTGWAATR